MVVVGTGSIGRRHIKNLKELMPETQVVAVSSSGREICSEEFEADETCTIQDVADLNPLFAVVASPATFHVQHALPLLKLKIPVLFEKPLARSAQDLVTVLDILEENASRIGVGYTLRFLPSFRFVKDSLRSALIGEIVSVSSTVGQFLPHWRPTADYRETVSAKAALGGGAVLELSHELDYLNVLFGPFKSVYACLKNTETLEIDVEDVVDMLLLSSRGPAVSCHMNFLQKSPERFCRITGTEGTLVWNLMTNCVHLQTSSQSKVIFDGSDFDRSQIYVKQLQSFIDFAHGKGAFPVSLREGIAVLEIVDAIKKSADSGLPVQIGS